MRRARRVARRRRRASCRDGQHPARWRPAAKTQGEARAVPPTRAAPGACGRQRARGGPAARCGGTAGTPSCGARRGARCTHSSACKVRGRPATLRAPRLPTLALPPHPRPPVHPRPPTPTHALPPSVWRLLLDAGGLRLLLAAVGAHVAHEDVVSSCSSPPPCPHPRELVEGGGRAARRCLSSAGTSMVPFVAPPLAALAAWCATLPPPVALCSRDEPPSRPPGGGGGGGGGAVRPWLHRSHRLRHSTQAHPASPLWASCWRAAGACSAPSTPSCAAPCWRWRSSLATALAAARPSDALHEAVRRRCSSSWGAATRCAPRCSPRRPSA